MTKIDTVIIDEETRQLAPTQDQKWIFPPSFSSKHQPRSPDSSTTKNSVTKTANTTTPKTTAARNQDTTQWHHNLASFEKGGLVFFLHIPKTGGSTIRINIEEKLAENIKYYFISGLGLYEQIWPQVQRYVSMPITGRRQRLPIFVEIHGRDSPNLLQLHSKLLEIKKAASKHNVPTYFFTILREPLQYQLSYFNFFHVQYGKINPKAAKRYFPQVAAPNADNLLKYAPINPQCQFMARGELSLRNFTALPIKPVVTTKECQQIYQVLHETMDWIGTTERLDIETLSILKHLLNLPPTFIFDPQLVMSSSNKTINEVSSSTLLSYQQLNSSTISQLRSMNQLDVELYTKIQNDHPPF